MFSFFRSWYQPSSSFLKSSKEVLTMSFKPPHHNYIKSHCRPSILSQASFPKHGHFCSTNRNDIIVSSAKISPYEGFMEGWRRDQDIDFIGVVCDQGMLDFAAGAVISLLMSLFELQPCSFRRVVSVPYLDTKCGANPAQFLFTLGPEEVALLVAFVTL